MGIAGKSGHAVRFFPKQFYCWGSQCCLRCVRLGWDAVSASLVLSLCCLRSCLRTCHPVPELAWSSAWDAVSGSLVLSLSCLRSCLPTCVPVCQLSAWDAVSDSLVLSLSRLRSCPFILQHGMLCPAPCSCLCLVFVLSPSLPACSSAWDAVSGSLVLSLFCLPTCLPACSSAWDAVSASSSCLCFVSGLVSQRAWSSAWDAVSGSFVLSLSCLQSCFRTSVPVCQLVLQSGMLCAAPWSCLCLVSGLVS